MYIPLVRERVRLQDRPGEFLVLRTDYERQVADVAGADDASMVEKNVPFASMFAVFEEAGAERRPPRSERPAEKEARSRQERG